MFADILMLTAATGLVFVVSVSLLLWDSQRFLRELARVRDEQSPVDSV
ncbi:MAG: hypothetical protein SFU83_07480 [Meiothermus sp.]|nr:hypothetical protein [Meiothermus sp.]